jgi:hypothetical protein
MWEQWTVGVDAWGRCVECLLGFWLDQLGNDAFVLSFILITKMGSQGAVFGFSYLQNIYQEVRNVG